MAIKDRDGIKAPKKVEQPENKAASIAEKYAALNKLILRDLNNTSRVQKPSFTLYSKDDISTWLSNPYQYESNLRKAVVYIYGASSHFRRLVQYFTSLSDFSYVVSPYRINPQKANTKTIGSNYRKVLDLMSIMSVKTQFPKILNVCIREDVFYGTIIKSADSISILQLPSDYCSISCIEGNVFNVTFNFSYFDSYNKALEYYPEEFSTKYNEYKKTNNKWIELDSPTSFAVKCNNDIPSYALPPFAGILRDIYDLEDYRNLKLTKTELENYAMLFMKLPMDESGNWLIDFDKAKDFWGNLDNVLPEEVGSVLTPMDIEKISFEKSNVGDTDTIADAEENLFTSAGVSSLLFNNSSASANALALSIKVDQALTFGIVKGIEDVVNRYIQSFSFGKYFRVNFLDVSPFNRKETGDAYLKACQYGMPMISYYCASQGLNQAEIDNMNFLETKVLGLQSVFQPLVSSAQMSTSTTSTTGSSVDADENPEGGRPTVDDTELSETGEETRELGSDWG